MKRQMKILKTVTLRFLVAVEYNRYVIIGFSSSGKNLNKVEKINFLLNYKRWYNKIYLLI